MLFPDLIPQELKDRKIWCTSGKNGDKTPYRLDGSSGVDYEHPESSFTSFDEAVRLYRQGGFDGVAMLVADGLAVIDLDHVAHDGQLTVEAQRIINQMDSFTERSQGGDGVHIILKMPAGFSYDRSRYRENHAGRECYIGPRPKVITVTGNREPTGSDDLQLRPVEVLEFLKEFMTKPPAPDPAPVTHMAHLEDDFIIDHLCRPGSRSSQLWQGELCGLPSDSDADYAFINAVLFYSDDPVQIERICRASNRCRPKWDKNKAYLARSIEKARSTYSGQRYDPDYRSKPIDYNDDGWLNPTTPATGGGENVNDQKPTKEAEAVTPPATSEETASKAVTPPKYVSPVPDDFSELGMAEKFVEMHGDKFKYCDGRGILHYNEKTGVWDEDPHSLQMEIIKDLDQLKAMAKARKDNAQWNIDHTGGFTIDGSPESDQRQKELESLKNDLQYAEELEKFVSKMRSSNKIKGVIDLVIPHIVIQSDKLDPDPYVLNTPDGLVDLKTGKIGPHNREAYCTKITKIGPSDVGVDVWNKFLDTITCDDRSLSGFLQLVVGMCLIGTVKTEKVIFLIGAGCNGKSTFTGSVMSVLGDYATAIDSEVLMNTRKNVMPAMATLRGVRMALASELAENRKIDTGQLKKLSSTDQITAERKYLAPETFKPSHTLILQSNYLPRVDALDRGTWRRILAIPFFATIDTSAAIENYAEVLFDQAGGAILAWAIEGAVNFTRNNYKLDPVPESVEETTAEYKTASNWIEIFLAECTETGSDSPAHEVYQKYSQWAVARGEHPRSETSFGMAMRAAGHGSEHVRAGSVYRDIKVIFDD